MIGELEDDTHYCVKCHSTINGLDNYVNHRKSDCGKIPPNVENIVQGEAFSLKADDFFSSLELQSSTKKSNPSLTGGKSLAGVLTRSKASAAINAVIAAKDFNRPKDELEWPENHNLTRIHSRVQEYCESEDDSEEYEYDDEETDYDEDDDINDAPPRSFTGGKWKPTSSPIQWTRPHSSTDDRDRNSPPPHYTGGKWKPHTKTSDDYHLTQYHTGGKWKSPSPKEHLNIPPPTFTGSKWSVSKVISKPESLDTKSSKIQPRNYSMGQDSKWNYQTELQPEHTKGKWKPVAFTQEPDNTKFVVAPQTKWKPLTFRIEETPTPSYTKGKWKPNSPQHEKMPLSSYAKGKWPILSETEISPFRKSSGRVQYWCGPCNRHLASKIVYERHLKSDLHNKRASTENDFERPCLSVNNAKNRSSLDTKSNESNSCIDFEEDIDPVPGSRTRKKIYLTCHACKSRVNYRSIGKHLVSHYHCSRSDLTLPESKKMILDSIYDIVLQSPFQCGPCKFYCNTHEWFLKHWVSDDHKNIIVNTGSVFWCSVCKFEVERSELMYYHLVSNEHTEIVAVINRSVPIVIRKITPIKCITCDQKFLFNIQLRKHCENLGHTHAFACSDEYQNKYTCSICYAVLKSKVALQRHEMSNHSQKRYICSICSLNFNSIVEAKRHRNTPEHRYAVLGKRQLETNELDISRTCQYCSERFENVLILKEHYKQKHPEHNSSCPYCGKSFIISQDLSVHIRKRACVVEQDFSKSKSCDECQFKSDSTSELIFHKVLHGEPVMMVPEDGDESKTILQYKCPICDRFLVKPSLRCHLRIHTKERPFSCQLCNAAFVRRNNFVLHMKNHNRKQRKHVRQVKQAAEYGDRPFLCSTCGDSFKKRSILKQHMTRHVGKSIKCTFPDCIFAARFQAELKNHLTTHSDIKSYSCDQCPYQGKTKQQLNRHSSVHEDVKKYTCSRCSYSSRLASHIKRHMYRHTGTKPFSCIHCSYSCNNLENLRKHIMLTNRHPGKCLYECKFCQGNVYETNFAKEFKVHLVTEHPASFICGKDAATYISGIYDADNNETSVHQVSDTHEKKHSAHKKLLRKDANLSQFQDTLQISGTTNPEMETAVLLTSLTTQDSTENKIQDELFPMLIVLKDETCIENPSESWNIDGSYDVEESGSLVHFQSVGETLFHEHFQ